MEFGSVPDKNVGELLIIFNKLFRTITIFENEFGWLGAPRFNQEALPVQNRTDDYFLVRKEKENGELQIIFAPLVKQPIVLEDAQEKREELIETWPKDAPGAWILFRDEKTGKPLRVRYYIVPDSRVFVEFTPDTEKSYAYFYIFGAAAAYRVPVPVNFEWFYTASLKDVKPH